MNKDYSYCTGVTCPIQNECRRYLSDPPGEPLWWITPAYKEELKQCPHFTPCTHTTSSSYSSSCSQQPSSTRHTTTEPKHNNTSTQTNHTFATS